MSVLAKIVTGIFGKKSDRDLKTLSPFIDDINSFYQSLETLSDEDLKQRFKKICDNLVNGLHKYALKYIIMINLDDIVYGFSYLYKSID